VIRLPEFLTVNQKLTIAIWMEKHLGVPFVLYGTGTTRARGPSVVVGDRAVKGGSDFADGTVRGYRRQVCRADLLFLKGVLEKMP